MSTLTAPQRRDRPDHTSARSTVETASLTLDPSALRARAARSTLADRVALRIALALVLWSTRPRRAPLSPLQRLAVRERELRERSWQQRHLRLPAI